MFYIIENNIIVSTADKNVDITDLKSLGYTVIESDKEYEIGDSYTNKRFKKKTVDLKALKNMTLAYIKSTHANLLNTLTGNASPEERDTWSVKATAAINKINKKATKAELAMLKKEADLRKISVDELANKILVKHEIYLERLGIYAGMKHKWEKMLKSVKTKSAIDDLNEEIKQYGASSHGSS